MAIVGNLLDIYRTRISAAESGVTQSPPELIRASKELVKALEQFPPTEQCNLEPNGDGSATDFKINGVTVYRLNWPADDRQK